MGEAVLSFGGNFRDKLYMGITIGIPRIQFEESYTYREVIDDSNSPLRSFTQTDDLETSGSGVNIKAGFIYRASPWLRLGVAAHTSTWLSLTDVYSTKFSASFEDLEGDPADYEAEGSFDYRLRTPPRYIGSAAFIIGKRGLISADYEYVDYSQAKLNPYDERIDDYEFNLENETIENLYRGTHNIRVGGELRILPPLKIRAGVMYQQSPFVQGTTGTNSDVIAVSGGIGYRGTKMHINISYTRQQTASDFYMYDSGLVDPVEIQRGQNQLLATLGWFL
jgi:long-subunit fatty acid transport protein